VLIYLGCLGLLVQSHLTLAATLQGALLAYFLYRAVRYVENTSTRNAALVGLSLGALALTRGIMPPVVLALALLACTRYLKLPLAAALRHLGIAAGVGFLISLLWMLPAALLQPFGLSPVGEWLDWNASQVGLPTLASLKGFLRIGVWFFWPAWPFALWAVWAWRRQQHLLHIVMPVMFFTALTVLMLFDPAPENGDFLKMLAPLALMAAFGLPTMKRGAINAIDWFSVMVLTILGALIWLFWIAKLTGWPAQLAKNALKLVPGFKPEIGIVAFLVAAATSIGWIMLVHWRLSRQPSVLWRAVVLSSSGLILVWVLLMTLFLPDLNYARSYAGVAQQIAATLPHDADCLDTNVSPAQRASFAYFGRLPFAGMAGGECRYVLLQDSIKNRNDATLARRHGVRGATVLWEGRRASDRDERFRLFRRAR
jgi:4-amino-4-deoxy-L-arabinose transferase-like glycosyltransferase